MRDSCSADGRSPSDAVSAGVFHWEFNHRWEMHLQLASTSNARSLTTVVGLQWTFPTFETMAGCSANALRS